MNNNIRAFIQRHFEAKLLFNMGGSASNATVLEIGCGRGVGVEIIYDIFGAKNIHAFDLDSDMVNIARKRLYKYGDKLNLWVGDVTNIQSNDNFYDAVFDFGIIHHVPNWIDALKEIYRVLKPGGRFYCEEIFEAFINFPIWRMLLDHPLENRFDYLKFINGLKETGFVIMSSKNFYQQFGIFIADK